MQNILESALEQSNVAVCVKDSVQRVLAQNNLCLRVCGNQQGEKCEVGCMELYARDTLPQWKDWGSRLYKNSSIHGNFYDVTLLCSVNRIITFLQPLAEKYATALRYYRDKGLTRRETEVISLAIQGISNAGICKDLAISKATLKTHLNRIYGKLRDSGQILEFIPSNRVLG